MIYEIYSKDSLGNFINDNDAVFKVTGLEFYKTGLVKRVWVITQESIKEIVNDWDVKDFQYLGTGYAYKRMMIGAEINGK